MYTVYVMGEGETDSLPTEPSAFPCIADEVGVAHAHHRKPLDRTCEGGDVDHEMLMMAEPSKQTRRMPSARTPTLEWVENRCWGNRDVDVLRVVRRERHFTLWIAYSERHVL